MCWRYRCCCHACNQLDSFFCYYWITWCCAFRSAHSPQNFAFTLDRRWLCAGMSVCIYEYRSANCSSSFRFVWTIFTHLPLFSYPYSMTNAERSLHVPRLLMIYWNCRRICNFDYFIRYISAAYTKQAHITYIPTSIRKRGPWWACSHRITRTGPPKTKHTNAHIGPLPLSFIGFLLHSYSFIYCLNRRNYPIPFSVKTESTSLVGHFSSLPIPVHLQHLHRNPPNRSIQLHSILLLLHTRSMWPVPSTTERLNEPSDENRIYCFLMRVIFNSTATMLRKSERNGLNHTKRFVTFDKWIIK